MSDYECVIEHGLSYLSYFGFCVSLTFQVLFPVLTGLIVGFIFIKRF